MKRGERLEDTIRREVKEETGQDAEETKYVDSYYSSENDLIMIGFIASVKKKDFSTSKEILDINWYPPNEALNVLVKGSIAKRHFERILELGII
jgi:NAD+ diphosphatase